MSKCIYRFTASTPKSVISLSLSHGVQVLFQPDISADLAIVFNSEMVVNAYMWCVAFEIRKIRYPYNLLENTYPVNAYLKTQSVKHPWHDVLLHSRFFNEQSFDIYRCNVYILQMAFQTNRRIHSKNTIIILHANYLVFSVVGDP